MAKGRPKPLHGSKKYDRAIFNCTTQDCENEFFVSMASTPAKRFCEECWDNKANKPHRGKPDMPDGAPKLADVLNLLYRNPHLVS